MNHKSERARLLQFRLRELVVGVTGLCALAWFVGLLHRADPEIPPIGLALSAALGSLPIASLYLVLAGPHRIGMCLCLAWITIGVLASILLPTVQ
jgi:hypothetical protein